MENVAAVEQRAAIFGYGSLINPKSIAKTLGRTLAGGELFPCRLVGYRRVWDVVDEILDPNAARKRAVFLNLRPDPSASVLGVGFYLSAAELRALDVRERNYDRVDVSGHLQPSVPAAAFTYVAKAEHLVADQEVCVLTRYEAIIEEGLEHWGPDFARAFRETTSPHGFPRFEGAYTFARREA